ncbi:hypothetical protein ACFP6A_08265 [Quadrisphaera sp. GCM10027208]|uniref:hypothetical protein n=1 Tax=Quadrisphaera sp. GCM10027208 TaxID=3273423 RepID=UPI0036094D8B
MGQYIGKQWDGVVRTVADVFVTGLSALAIVAALALAGYAIACRRGRTPDLREWAFGSEETASTTMLMLPGGAAMLAAVGLLGLTRVTSAVGPLVVVCAVIGVVLVLWAGLHLPVPLALYPSWAREQRARVRARRKG